MLRSVLLCSALAPALVTILPVSAGADGLPVHKPALAAPISTLPPTLVMPNAQTGLKKGYGGTPIDVTLYHYDNYRTGWNQSETDLTPATVASKNFGLLTTLNVDGNVFPQPLQVSGFVMPDGSTHDVLIIATGHDSVYAFDAQTYSILWQVSMGTSQNTNDVGCGDVKPEYGISSTPVIVRQALNQATIYLVAATEPSQGTFETKLHALDLGTGLDIQSPVTISPSAKLSDGSTVSFDPQAQWSRTSLGYNNGSLYIGIGSHCDNNSGSITGWLLRYDTKLKLHQSFHTIDTQGGTELASIWMTGFAPAIDPNGNVFVVTGNGDFTKHQKDWGESVLSLSPSLAKVQGQFTPSNYQTLNDGDIDFGSGGVMLLPQVAGQTAPPMAVAMGKSQILYLLNQTNLGGETKANKGPLQQIHTNGGLWGGPAFYNGFIGPSVFVQGNDDVLHGFSVNTGSTPSLTQYAAGTTNAGYGGSLPIVSSNGAQAETGIVWLIRRSAPFQLEAYDAQSLGAPIFAANAGTWSNPSQGNPFLTPMEANGRVYAPGYKTVAVFGLQ